MKIIFILIAMDILLGVRLSASSVSIKPETLVTRPGATFSVNVLADTIADLYAYQFDVTFGSASTAAISVQEGTFLSAAGSTNFTPGMIDNSEGSISFVADSLAGAIPGQSGTGTLVTIGFTALSPGIDMLTLSNAIFLDSTLSAISVTLNSGTVSVEGTPEPSSAWLIGMGAAILWLKRFFARSGKVEHVARRCEDLVSISPAMVSYSRKFRPFLKMKMA